MRAAGGAEERKMRIVKVALDVGRCGRFSFWKGYCCGVGGH
jgi:hypothetical protein